LGDDYDWQLFDITGHNPNDVFTVPSLFVGCNWSGSTGITGASAQATKNSVCATTPQSPNQPLFSSMPVLQKDHQYLMLVSHFAGDSQSGYDLQFSGGSASITDTTPPRLKSLALSCDAGSIGIKLNKKNEMQ